MKYDAFISYRHDPRDVAIAEKLHKLLERYRVPKAVQKATGKKKIQRVFRDRDELTIADNLSDNLLSALDESEYLLVICSPESKESIWVQREVEYFIKTHDRNHVLAILTAGEPEESFPELIRYDEVEKVLEDGSVITERIDVEPLAADVRADSLEESLKILKKEKLRVLAALLGCEYNDLKQRHKEAIMRQRMAIGSVVVALTTAFSIYANVQNVKIQKEYTEKQISQARNLASYSEESLRKGDRETAILLALEALPESQLDKEKPLVPDAVSALTDAIYAYQIPGNNWFLPEHVITIEGDTATYGENYCQLSPGGMYFGALDLSQKLQVYDTRDNTLLWEKNLSDFELEPLEESYYDEIYQYADFVSDKEMVVITTRRFLGVDTTTGEVLWTTVLEEEIQGTENLLAGDCVEISEDRTTLVAYFFEHYLAFDLKKHELLAYGKVENESNVEECDVAFSPDMKSVLLSSRNAYLVEGEALAENLHLIDLATGKVETLPCDFAAVFATTYLSDGSVMMLTSKDMITLEPLNPVIHVNYQLVRYHLDSKEYEVLYEGENGYDTAHRPQLVHKEVTLDDGTVEERIVGFLGTKFFVMRENGEMTSQVVTDASITNIMPHSGNGVYVGLGDGTIARYSLLWDSEYPLYNMVVLEGYQMNSFVYNPEEELLLQIPQNGNRCIVNRKVYDEDYRTLPVEEEVKNSGYMTIFSPEKEIYRQVITEHHLMLWSLGDEEELILDMAFEDGRKKTPRLLFREEDDHLLLLYSEDWTDDDDQKYESIQLYDITEDSIVWGKEAPVDYPEIYCSVASSYIIWENARDFVVLDKMTGESKEVDHSKMFTDGDDNRFTQDIKFSPDGKYAIWIAGSIFDDKTVYRYDLENDTWDIIPGLETVENYIDAIVMAKESNQMAYSKDGTSIDIYDLDTLEIVNQIPIQGKSRVKYFFMNNEKYLLYLSDDNTLRTEDLELNETVMEDTERYTGITFYSWDDETYLRVRANRKQNQGLDHWGAYSLYIFRVDEDGTFDLYTQIPDGFASIAAKEVLVTNPDEDSYIGVYPFYDLDQLIEKAKKILGDHELTETEKVRYFIENN